MGDNGVRVRAVECEAEVWHIKTNASSTFDVSFQFPEYMLPQVQWLLSHMKMAVRMVIEETKPPL